MASPLFRDLGLASGFGQDPGRPYYGKSIGRFDQIADTRDYLANLVGSGSKTFDENVKGNYTFLSKIFGQPLAEKILNHVFVFNNRSDMQSATPEERISAFYNLGSSDKELQDVFIKAKTFGKGPIAGLNESVNIGNQLLNKRATKSKNLVAPSMVKTIMEEIK